MAQILNGKIVAEAWLAQLKEAISEYKTTFQQNLSLLIIQVGDDPATNLYINNKKKAAKAVGVDLVHEQISLATLAAASDPNQYVVTLMQTAAAKYHGILLQMPLPSCLDEQYLISELPTECDVDGFSPGHVNAIWTKKNFDPLTTVCACTPKGIIKLLRAYDISVAKKHVVIINRSNIVGKPLAALMLALDATVTICHSKTENLRAICQTADIVISGVGRANFLDHTYVNARAVVIDVGINWDQAHKLCGDVTRGSLDEHCLAYSPVPQGVGPMTVAAIFANLLSLGYLRATKK